MKGGRQQASGMLGRVRTPATRLAGFGLQRANPGLRRAPTPVGHVSHARREAAGTIDLHAPLKGEDIGSTARQGEERGAGLSGHLE